jgi:L-cysteine/cystine lyase
LATVQHDTTFALVREQMPSTADFVFLNTGSYGPIPRVTVEAMNAHIQREFEESRSFVVQKDVSEAARQAFAETFNCDTANVALTRHTTDGMNIGILGLNWRSGDEVIITDTEHPGGQYPVYVVARRYGVEVRTVRLGVGAGDVVAQIEAAITPRTRAIVTSHLTWNTGTVLPIKEIAELAHKHDILVFCDAAQSAGSIAADMRDLDVDVYATPGQKWMCAPEGTGAAYVSDRALERVSPTFVGSKSFAGVEHTGGHFIPKRGAQRFEVAGVNQPAVLGYAASVNWMRDDIGMDWIYERIARLGKYAHERLSSLDGIRVVTPKERMAGLVSFQIDCMPPSELVVKLAERKIIIRHIGYPICARIATGFYNSEEDIDTLIDAISDAQDEVNSQSS